MPVVFQPQTIEITKKLDLTGLGDSEAEALRRKLYAPESVESHYPASRWAERRRQSANYYHLMG